MKKVLLPALFLSTFAANAAYIDEGFTCDSTDHLIELSEAWNQNDMATIEKLVVAGECDTIHEHREVKGVMNPGNGYVVFRFDDTDKTGVTLTRFLKDY
ncbi:hypothetical protein [Enterobacter sp.]|uniref:hypothetical protein n=1 Tax=Enterobacter sp. TaxID=42895 RepID=UPI00296EAD87|nr:hypothetical protein [Enterobacter sp.]